ncbi:MAG: PDZ domain-containing protein [Gemmatimonadetes bacterium]|nr:PDZ domain-containing protein [Gemmatimonadota bacterium]NIO31791.1 PDZ domain-containing protein [Gemmatimonadota bacterium]
MTAKYKIPFLVVGALFVVWGVLGLLEVRDRPYGGFSNGLDYVVNEVEEGSPAAAAGLEVGDRIITYNGIAVEDARAFREMPWPQIGETRVLVVERTAETTLAAGEEGPVTLEIALTYGARPLKYHALSWAAFIVGLCFIGCGLLAYIKAPSRPAMLLAVAGLCMGVSIVGGPYIGSYTLRTIINSIILVLELLGFGALLHLLMVFPKRKAFLARTHAAKVLYAPIALIALFSLWLIIFVSQRTGMFNTVVNVIYGIFSVVYLGLALVALIHSFVKATPDERSRYGLNLMLAGLVIAVLPIVFVWLVSIFAPNVIVPGSDFLILAAVLVPITMALAVMKAEPAAAPEPAPVM